MKRGLPLLVFVLVACGGGKGQVTPIPAADASLRTFIQSAVDSNLTAMGEHWGTSRGSAASTGVPADYQKRMAIVQTYLSGIAFRVLSNEPRPGLPNERVIQVELTRPGCVNVVPFTMIRTSHDQWLVNEFDLEKVSRPGRACGASDGAPR
ncbi:MAG: hypothetical protein ABI613_04550 [Gemmatimonadota bacterium]